MVRIKQTRVNSWSDAEGANFRLCDNTVAHDNCNWLVAADDPDLFCLACRLNRTIPNLVSPDNRRRWRVIEAAKRRLVYSLLGLGLPVRSQIRGWPFGLAFDFVEDQYSNPNVQQEHVLTHHANGVITLNVSEADDVTRVRVRELMNERYRTLLGHFRHESGHYYFSQLVADETTTTRFRQLFGDERADYAAALDRSYRDGPPSNWQVLHISAYAATHPTEDWAETWAHYLHMLDGLETAAAYALVTPTTGGIDAMLTAWSSFSVPLNEVTRSLGLPDAYPFVISERVAEKLRFVHEVLPEVANHATDLP